MSTRNLKLSSATRKLLAGVFIVLLLLLGFYAWYTSASNEKIEQTPREAKTTSNLDTAQDDFDDGDIRSIPKKNDAREGGAVENNQPVVAPPPSQQLTSDSGVITVYTPARDSTIKSGSVLSGKSSTDSVYFRLVDSAVGVIAQGPLTVSGGNFSGTLQFSSKGKTGSMNVFSIDKGTDREVNLVEYGVKF